MDAISEPAVKSGKNKKILGVITIIMGVLAISAPLITGLSIALLVGLLVLVGGVARMVWAFHAGSVGKGMLRFIIGGLTLLCGMAMVTDPILASGVLTIILAIYLAIDGVFEIATAFKVRPLSGWGVLLAGGILSLLLALMIWRQYPLSGPWAIGFMLGLKLLFIGTIMISVAPIVQEN